MTSRSVSPLAWMALGAGVAGVLGVALPRLLPEPATEPAHDQTADPQAQSQRPAPPASASKPAPRAGGNDAELSPAELFRRIAPSVVVVLARMPDGVVQGSGVVVSAGTVITARGVVDGASQILVRQADESWPVSGAKLDSQHDLAKLAVPRLSLPPLPLRPSQVIDIGERVYAVGAARDLQLSLSEGLFTGLRHEAGETLIQTTAGVSQGSRGGGLFDARGRLMGITTWQRMGSERQGFALPARLAESVEGPTLLVAGTWTAPDFDPSGTRVAVSEANESETDRRRAEGAQAFEEAVLLLGEKADDLDVQWRRYKDACAGRHTSTYTYGRGWFGIWEGVTIAANESMPQCRTIYSDIERLSEEIRVEMAAADEAARRSWVYPGTRRSIRRKYLMDWSGWDE